MRYPACQGAINVDEPFEDAIRSDRRPLVAGIPAAYAQVRFDEERNRERLKKRALFPVLTAVALIVLFGTFLAAAPFGAVPAAFAIGVVILISVIALLRLPWDSLVWAKGIEGELATAALLEPLISRGFIALYNRLVPTAKGDLDALLVGPTGIFAIETKNWSKRAEVRFDMLWVGDADRASALEQTFRNALAVQIVLGDGLANRRLNVVPILCLVGGLKGGRAFVRGVNVVDRTTLVAAITSRELVCDAAAVDELARVAESRIRTQRPWEQRA